MVWPASIVLMPAPLNKAGEVSWPLRYDSSVLALHADGRAARERLLLTLGPTNTPVIDLHLERELAAGVANAAVQTPRASVAVGLPAGERAPLPEQGIALQARLGELDVDAWRRLADTAALPPTQAGAWLPGRVSLQADAITTEQSGQDAMRRILLRGDPPDAVFAASDLIAIGAMHALAEAGLSVPGDVAVVGFDDITAASLANPPLTTVAQDARRAGEMLVDTLLAQLRDETVEGATLPARLVVRRSTGVH